MLNISQMKADAEEGLRIAKKAQAGPWFDAYSCVHSTPLTDEYSRLEALIPEGADDNHPGWETLPDTVICAMERVGKGDLPSPRGGLNGRFIADSRTRAPDAYRNVIALVEENERLTEHLRLQTFRADAADDFAEDLKADAKRLLAEVERLKREKP